MSNPASRPKVGSNKLRGTILVTKSPPAFSVDASNCEKRVHILAK